MANELIVSSSYQAILDTSSTVASQTYLETAPDQVLGSNSALINDTYDESLACYVKGQIATTSAKVPIVSESFWKAGYTLVGTEPAKTDKIQIVYVKAGQIIGQADNSIELLCGSTSMCLLTPGQGVQFYFDKTTTIFTEVTVKAKYYSAGVDEIGATIALIGA